MAKKKLIKVKKGDEVIEISPLTLADHQSLGWVVVEEKEAEASAEKSKPSTKAAKE